MPVVLTPVSSPVKAQEQWLYRDSQSTSRFITLTPPPPTHTHPHAAIPLRLRVIPNVTLEGSKFFLASALFPSALWRS